MSEENSPPKKSLADEWIERGKNTKLIAAIIVATTVIAGIATFTNALKAVGEAFGLASLIQPAPCSNKGVVGKWFCKSDAPDRCRRNHETSALTLDAGGKVHHWVDGEKTHGVMEIDFVARTFVLTFDNKTSTKGTLNPICSVIYFPEFGNYATKL